MAVGVSGYTQDIQRRADTTGYPVSSLDIDLAEMDGETTCL